MKAHPTLRKALQILMLAGALLGFGLVVANTGPLAPTRVTLVSVSAGQLAPALFGIGTVEARRSYQIGPNATGRVLKVNVDVGDAVAAGQWLAEMDPIDLDERITALEAGIARAQSAIAAAEAQRQDSQARQQTALANAKRYEDLFQKKFVSPSAIEAKRQELASAQALYAASSANLSGAKHDVTRLTAERAALQQQRLNVRLRAPAAGIVTAREAEPGSTVVGGQAVLRLIEPGSLWLRVRLDQARSGGLALGLPAHIVLRSLPGQPLTGKVVRIEPLSDSVTEERIVQVAFADGATLPQHISVGELAEVTIQLPATQSGLLLPNASLRRHGEQLGVWVLRDAALHFSALRLGSSSLDGQVQVLAGLQAGDQVILHSEKEIHADSRIKVVDRLGDHQPTTPANHKTGSGS